MLDRDGYIYKIESSAEEALDVLQEDKFALMISDINMPSKTGIDLLHDVNKSYKDISVIMATAVDDRNVAIQSFYMSAYGYITKLHGKIVYYKNRSFW